MIYVCYPNNKEKFEWGVMGFPSLDLKIIRQNAYGVLKQQGLTIDIRKMYIAPRRVCVLAWYTNMKIINSLPTGMLEIEKFLYENIETQVFALGTIQI